MGRCIPLWSRAVKCSAPTPDASGPEENILSTNPDAIEILDENILTYDLGVITFLSLKNRGKIYRTKSHILTRLDCGSE